MVIQHNATPQLSSVMVPSRKEIRFLEFAVVSNGNGELCHHSIFINPYAWILAEEAVVRSRLACSLQPCAQRTRLARI